MQNIYTYDKKKSKITALSLFLGAPNAKVFLKENSNPTHPKAISMKELQKIEALYNNKKYQECFNSCKVRLLDNTKDNISLEYAIKSSQELKLTSETLFYLRRLHELQPRDDKVASQIGKCYYLLGDIEKSKEWISISLEINPTNSQSLSNKGLIYYLEGNLEKAKATLQLAIDSNASQKQTYLILADLHFKQKEFDDCIKMGKNAISIDPNCPKINLTIAKAFKEKRDSKNCEAALLNELRVDPQNAEASIMLAELKIKNKDFSGAEIILKSCLKEHPNNSIAHKSLGLLYMRAQMFTTAETSFMKAIELDDKDYISRSCLGNIYLNGNYIEKAIKTLKESLEIKPAAVTLVNLSLAYESKKNSKAAIMYAYKATEIENRSAEAYLNLSKIESRLGSTEKAIKAAEKAIKLNIYSADAYLVLAGLLEKQKDFCDAIKLLNKANKLIPENHILNGELVRIKFVAGLFDDNDKSYPWKINDDYYFEDCSGSALIISFGSNGRIRMDENNTPLFDFRKVLKSLPNYDKLYLRDMERLYYMNGLKNSAPSISKLRALIENHISAKKYKKIVTIGASSGGFGALLYGNLINADKMIAFNPQTVLTKAKEDEIKDNIFTVSISKHLRSLNKGDSFYQKCLDIKNFIPFNGHAVIHYSSDSPNKIDAKYANYLKHSRCSIISHNSGTHLLAAELKDKNKLEEIIFDSISLAP